MRGLPPRFAGRISGVALLKEGVGKDLSGAFFLAIGIFDTFISLGLFVHEFRGIQDCYMLIAIGCALERRMAGPKDAPCGPFSSRLCVGSQDFPISRVSAALLIYPAMIASWVFLGLYPRPSGSSSQDAIAIFLAAVLIKVMAALVGHWELDRYLKKVKYYIEQYGDYDGLQTYSWYRKCRDFGHAAPSTPQAPAGQPTQSVNAR